MHVVDALEDMCRLGDKIRENSWYYRDTMKSASE
jgi:hypothetical protein